MIRAKAGSIADGKCTILLGLTSENVARLVKGEPIRMRGETVGEPTLDVVLFYGVDEGAIKRMMEEHGLIGPATKVTVDPRIEAKEN